MTGRVGMTVQVTRHSALEGRIKMKLGPHYHGRYSWAATGLLVLLLATACSGQSSGAPAPQATTAAQPTVAAPAATAPPPPSQPAATALATMTVPGATASPASATPSRAATPEAQGQLSPEAAACVPGAAPTLAQTEGPYYRANPPQRASLIDPGMAGTRLLITGRVLTVDCQPLGGARVDFWQADDSGSYDNSGYRLRGFTLTDGNGSYSMETIVPGLYPGRTRHIHVKVQAQGGQILTTQLYFPNEPANNRDSIFNPQLVMDVKEDGGGRTATFDFTLATQ